MGFLLANPERVLGVGLNEMRTITNKPSEPSRRSLRGETPYPAVIEPSLKKATLSD
jgi:hypothetical protein